VPGLVLDQGGAAFDPVAVVAVGDAVHVADLGVVDMAADDAVEAAAAGFLGQRRLEVVDVLDRVLDLELEVGRQRPVGIAEPAAHQVVPIVERQREVVGGVAQVGEPLGVFDHAVELVAVDDQELAPVGAFEDGVAQDHHLADGEAVVVPRDLVVVAGDVDDPRAVAGHGQELLQDLVVGLGPVPVAGEAPAVDDVADQEELVAVVAVEELE
jgi:hypothetical protein